MEHDVSEKNLKEIISELLRLGYEGTYWDFKEDYTDCREDKLIDIICMANNIDGHQAYLIYGADDNGNVKGIEKTKYSRYTTKSVTEFLRSNVSLKLTTSIIALFFMPFSSFSLN